MNKTLIAASLAAVSVCVALPATAERYVMITHTQGTDPF